MRVDDDSDDNVRAAQVLNFIAANAVLNKYQWENQLIATTQLAMNINNFTHNQQQQLTTTTTGPCKNGWTNIGEGCYQVVTDR